MSIILNTKQKIASDKINDFISQTTDKIFYLFGFAGTGKTYLISHIIKELLISHKLEQIFVCAPTHKALNVIESYLKSNLHEAKEYLPKIIFMTIHKLLEFKPVIMAENGSKIFKPKGESAYLKEIKNKLIVIDECSMISKEMVVELDKYTNLYPIKVIFMGDKKQLPPIGEKESLIFTNACKKYNYYVQLNEIMRTNSSSIKEICTVIRNWNREDSLAKLFLPIHNQKTSPKSFRLYHKKTNYLESTWFKHFVQKIEKGDVPIILTWKNATSDKYNIAIRKYVHKVVDINNYAIGDYVIFNNFYLSQIDIDSISFYTSDMVKIIEITNQKEKLFDWNSLKIASPKSMVGRGFNILLNKLNTIVSEITIDTMTVEKIHSDVTLINHLPHTIKTVHREELEAYQNMIAIIQEHIESFYKKYKSEKMASTLWNTYHKKLIEPYAEINFGYSITTHKAQGSTFGSVYVDVQDICENPNIYEMQKALYTAAGRAAVELGFMI